MPKFNIYKCGTLLSLIVIIIFSCAPVRTIPPAKMEMPVYDFTPPVTSFENKPNTKIALLEPGYDGTFKYSNKSPFKQFRISMARDIEEMLTSRGYVIKGPFEVYDLMTYSDKQECELGLFIDIYLDIEQAVGGWNIIPGQAKRGFNPATAGYQTYKGTLNLNGKISIYFAETFTKQKLLVKSVPISQAEINVASDQTYPIGTTGIPMENTGVHNPVAKALVEFYRSAMQQAWNMTEASEVAHIYAQVPDIRKNAGFIKN